MLNIMRAFILAGVAATTGITPAAAQAPAADSLQGWPNRFISLMVPFGAGSGTDTVARIIAVQISEILGKQVVIENVGGAGGTIGVARVAKAPADGYAMVLGAVDTFAQSQYLFAKPPYDSVGDFVPVALAVEQPLVIVARKELPITTLKDFAEYARANNGKLRFGSAGIGAAPYLACATLNDELKIQNTHVPYRSAAPALQDMLAGDIDYYCPLAISAVRLIENQSVKALAVLTGERSALFPDLPTAREQGVNVTEGYYWMGFFMPKGTPEPIVAAMNSAISKALDDAGVQKRLRDAAATVVPPNRRSVAYMETYLKSEIANWSTIMKRTGVAKQ